MAGNPAVGLHSDDLKEQVRQATDIVDLVGGYIQLRRQGRNFVGLCPWHDDSKPSLTVNPERQSFKCWPCDIGGDVFSFLMQMENLEFREALEQLAERAGIELKPTGGPRAAPGSPGDKRTLLAAMAWAEEVYHRCLLGGPLANDAREYIAERGISPESLARFRIGYAPPAWDWLLKQGAAAGYSPAVLERVNLITARNSGDGWYDHFRGRVLFPIRDVRSRPVAIGGRILPSVAKADTRADYTPAKYVNSAETPIYSKSHQLYALDLARDAINEEDAAVVVEGYTDVVACHQAGVQNVVAACGTAMGEGHLKLIRRFTDRIVLVLDGDEAGRKRASELLELFVASPIDLRILTLPGQLDPCDFVASHGGDKFTQLVRDAPDAFEHKLRSVTEGMVAATEDTHAVSRAAESVLATLARAQPVLGESGSAMFLREQSLIGRMSRRLGLPEAGLRQRLTELRRTNPTGPAAAAPPADEPAPARTRLRDMPVWDREALELMLVDDAYAQQLAATLGEVDFASPAARRLFAIIRETAESGEATYARIMSAIEDQPTKTLLVELDESATSRSTSNPAQRLNDLLKARDRRQEGADRAPVINALRTGDLPNQDADAALAGLFASRKRHDAGSSSTDG